MEEVEQKNEMLMRKGKMSRQAKAWMTASIVLGVLMLMGVGFGIYGMVMKGQATSENRQLKEEVKIKDDRIASFEESLGMMVGESETAEPEENEGKVGKPVVEATVAKTGYIYIGEWGIKIKIPEDLGGVSYMYNARGYVCVSGAKRGIQYAPEFADIEKNLPGLGCVRRYHVSDEEHKYSTEKTQIGDYVYMYSGPQAVYSMDAEEQKMELEAVQLIKTMLTEGISKF